MVAATSVSGDELLGLLGLRNSSARVQACLAQFARGMQPELDADDEEAFVDWVTVNELGLELGFEDEAYVLALAVEKRRQAPLLLTQFYFYGDTKKTMPFPYALPFGLDFSDDRFAVHHKLVKYEGLRRSYVRDAWSLPDFNMIIAYRADMDQLESVLCYVPHSPWPLTYGEREVVAAFTPETLATLFGLRWSSSVLRIKLEVLGYASALPEVRSEHSADLRMAHGIEFTFAPGSQIPAADPNFPRALALASVTYYGARVYDAREWAGPMPLNLAFGDSQSEIVAKVGRKPDERQDLDRIGFALWHLESYTLRAEYSNIENRLLRATIMSPGYWVASGAGADE